MIRLSDFKYGLLPRKSPLGKEFWVLSSSSSFYGDLSHTLVNDADGDTRIFTTIDAAIGQCQANRGDVIHVLPGHTESVSAAGGITCDIAGVTIIGHGNGEERPVITLDTAATADIAVSAGGVKWVNCVFDAGFADIETVFELTGATNFNLVDCEFVEQTVDENFLHIVRTSTVDNAADGLKLVNCVFRLVDVLDENILQLRGNLDGLVVHDCYIKMGVKDNDAIIECATGKDITNCNIQRNVVYRLNTTGDLFIENDTTANSGIVAYNLIRHADTAEEILVDAAGVGLFENRGTALDTASGYVLPALDS